MKSKIQITLAILLIISFQDLYGQRTASRENYDVTAPEQLLTGELFAQAYTIDAATFFNKEWLPGDIYLSNGEVVKNKLLRYNGLLDELLWQEPKSNNIVKLDKEAIRQFHFRNLNGDTSVYFRKIKIKKSMIADSSEIFAELIYEGSLSLLVFHNIIIEGREHILKNGNSYEKNVYAEEPVYIFRYINNKTFFTTKLNRRSLFAFLPENKNKIKEFLKSDKTGKFIYNTDLIRLTQFLNTIVNQ
jgi:hypothetical protein